ncbi:MAG: hypothetical protein NUW01_00375 [Gemmatimonadaceae bacterium]|nr:hypothetical protein [Gemmatimonadaceae bacterium]
MSSARMRRSWLLACAAVLAGVTACGDSLTEGTTGDANPPALDLAGVETTVDTILAFSADARDNLGIKTVHVSATGGVAFTFDTTFTSAVTTTSIPFSISVPRSVPPGTSVTVTGFATDGSGNRSVTDTLRLVVGNLLPPDARIISPPNGTVAVVGKSLVLSIVGKSGLKVRSLGFVTSGVLTAADSTNFSTPLRDSVSISDTLTIPDGTPPGQLTVTPFVYDSLGQRSLGPSIVLSVQTAASTTSTPVVTFGTSPRVEVGDTIHVAATDQTGIANLGYEVRITPTGSVVAADSIVSTGQITSLFRTFTMALPFTTFPQTIYVRGFATNAIGTRAYALLASGEIRTDTITVVAGATRPLPSGGSVADALYHPVRDRLYLTNIERNRLEVFSFADSTFKPSIPVGSRPWGITAWPVNRRGDMGDRLLVANSGGTSISYVDLNPAPLFPSGRVSFTYALPNILAYSVTTVKSATDPDVSFQQRTLYDFSDRPQFLAATCRGGTGPTDPCGDVLLVYSTTPTGGQSIPFPNKGSVRWENLSDSTSHFFFEQAIGQGAGRSDTLGVIRYAAAGFGPDSVDLVPVFQRTLTTTGDTALRSIVVVVERLGFRDTTFVRNSGNFRRAILGEGGPVLGSRALMYDATRGLEGGNVIDPVIDLGVSRAASVNDFIANSFSRVSGAAINFDGELAAIRGDSTYLIDATLRLQGLFQTSGGNPGFDFHPDNAGNGTSIGLTSCYSFAASSEPVIEIYENRSFARVNTVPIRDPIIGPIKSALRPGEIVLVGATARGVVIVTLPSNFVSGCP